VVSLGQDLVGEVRIVVSKVKVESERILFVGQEFSSDVGEIFEGVFVLRSDGLFKEDTVFESCEPEFGDTFDVFGVFRSGSKVVRANGTFGRFGGRCSIG